MDPKMDPKTAGRGRPAKPRTGPFLYLLRKHGVSNADFAKVCGREFTSVKKWHSGQAPVPEPVEILELIREKWPKLADDLEPIWLAHEKQKPPVPTTTAKNESPATPVPSSAAAPQPSELVVQRYLEEDLTWPVLAQAVRDVTGYPEDTRCEPGLRAFWKETGWTAWDWNTSPKNRATIFGEVVGVSELSRGLRRGDQPTEVREALRSIDLDSVDELLQCINEVRPRLFPAIVPGDFTCPTSGRVYDHRRQWAISCTLEQLVDG